MINDDDYLKILGETGPKRAETRRVLACMCVVCVIVRLCVNESIRCGRQFGCVCGDVQCGRVCLSSSGMVARACVCVC